MITRNRVGLTVLLIVPVLLLLRGPGEQAPQAPERYERPAMPQQQRSAPRDVRRQRDVGGVAVEDLARRRLLDVARVQPWEAHGVRILAGEGPSEPNGPQDLSITPTAAALSLADIAARVRRICRELDDPCRRRDYRLIVTTTAGTVPLQLHERNAP